MCRSKKSGRRYLWSSVFQLCFLMWRVDRADGSSRPNCNYSYRDLTYAGSINITEEGLTCQRWDQNYPHATTSELTDANFPDGSRSDAQNFCRNPFSKDRNNLFNSVPWCYTTDPNVLWQYCRPHGDETDSHGPTAYGACVLERRGAGYSGHVDFTRTGFACDLWRLHWNSSFVFQEGSAKKARNYCRNPTPSSRVGPWCFTTSEIVRWDYCDVCTPFRGVIVRREAFVSRDRFKLPYKMSLVNCLHWCITYLSCVGVDFQREKDECWYTPFKGVTKNTDSKYDHYDVERNCLGMASRPLNRDQKEAVESTTLLQKHSSFRRNRLMTKISGIRKTVSQEGSSGSPQSNSLKLNIKDVDRSSQLTPHDRPEENSVDRSALRADNGRKAGLRFSQGKSRIQRAEKAEGTATRSERLLRQRRAERIEVSEESKLSVRADKKVNATAEKSKTKAAKTSQLARILACLMIAMAAIVLISTGYAFYQISYASKQPDVPVKPAAKDKSAKNKAADKDKPEGSKVDLKKSVSNVAATQPKP